MQDLQSFSIRVYGILLNETGTQLLLSDENIFGGDYTKFVGGGVELGEGLKAALVREFEEELGVAIEVGEHIYTTDFFVRSKLRTDKQIICVYYKVRLLEKTTAELPCSAKKYDYEAQHGAQSLRWMALENLQPTDMSFLTEQKVVELLLLELGRL